MCYVLSGPRCVAVFDSEVENDDELSFREGDVISLQEYVDENWALGQLGGCSGIFPLNFVEVIQDLPSPPSQTQQPTQSIKIALPGETASNTEWFQFYSLFLYLIKELHLFARSLHIKRKYRTRPIQKHA